jgi:hypothetical protein
MKIIRVSNFDLESYAQTVAAYGVNVVEGMLMLEALQKDCDGHSPTSYRLVDDNFVLWRGMAEFVDTDENEFFE